MRQYNEATKAPIGDTKDQSLEYVFHSQGTELLRLCYDGQVLVAGTPCKSEGLIISAFAAWLASGGVMDLVEVLGKEASPKDQVKVDISKAN